MNFLRFYQIAKVPVSRYSNHLNSLRLPVTQNVTIHRRVISTTMCKPCEARPQTKFVAPRTNNESLLSKIVKKIPFLNVNKHKLNVSGYLLYESVADKINYAEFFDEFSLPDTFYSWFVITELHVWMLMVRCMAEGDDGRYVRNSIVQAMWSDVSTRAKKLGAHNPSGVRMQIQELNEQFQAALIAYDEGIQGDDKILAGALWRRFYQQKEADPEHLDALVKYIRKQIRLLDNISCEQLFSEKKFNWEAINKP